MFENSNMNISRIDDLINQHFTVSSVKYNPVSVDNSQLKVDIVPSYVILRRSDTSENMSRITEELRKLGYIAILRPHPTMPSRGLLYVAPLSKKMRYKEKQQIKTPIILFIATVLSIFFVGYTQGDMLGILQLRNQPLMTAILYTIGLISIIGIHELGHMTAAKNHGIEASWPYFIPFPFGYGTMGAFISQKEPMRNKNQLFDIGISGPIFGFVISLIIASIGLSLSVIVPESNVENTFGGILDISIPLFEILKMVFITNYTFTDTVALHPFAFSGFFGFFLTGLNLIPAGQLDGGHVVRSLLNESQHRVLTYIMIGIMILIGLWVMALFILYMFSQTGHSGPLDDLSTISYSRRVIGIICIVLAILCFPIPINTMELIMSFI